MPAVCRSAAGWLADLQPSWLLLVRPCLVLTPAPAWWLQVGLTWAQAILFYEAAAHHMLAIATIAFAVAPIVYIFTEVRKLCFLAVQMQL